MSQDFFTHFPELVEDIPTYMGVPAGIGGTVMVPSRRRREDDEDVKRFKGQRAAIC